MNIGIDIDDTINNLHEILIKKGTEFKRVYNWEEVYKEIKNERK